MQVVDTETGESTTQNINNIEVYENVIENYLAEFCDNLKIEDMTKETQNRWNAALLYINKYVFKGKGLLYTNDRLYNRYDISKVNTLCDMYINLCYIYDKEVSIMGFSKLSGIDTDTINSWGNNECQSSFESSVIHKKLTKEREESLSGMLISGKRNPVGILGALNRHYQWNMPGVRESKDTKAITAQTPEQIAKQYNNAIDVGTAAELPPV